MNDLETPRQSMLEETTTFLPIHLITINTVSSMREISDLSNLDNSLWIITTGESGQPFSSHYSDLLSLWDQNQYQSMDFSPQSEKQAIRKVLILQPSQSSHQP